MIYIRKCLLTALQRPSAAAAASQLHFPFFWCYGDQRAHSLCLFPVLANPLGRRRWVFCFKGVGWVSGLITCMWWSVAVEKSQFRTRCLWLESFCMSQKRKYNNSAWLLQLNQYFCHYVTANGILLPVFPVSLPVNVCLSDALWVVCPLPLSERPGGSTVAAETSFHQLAGSWRDVITMQNILIWMADFVRWLVSNRSLMGGDLWLLSQVTSAASWRLSLQLSHCLSLAVCALWITVALASPQ